MDDWRPTFVGRLLGALMLAAFALLVAMIAALAVRGIIWAIGW